MRTTDMYWAVESGNLHSTPILPNLPDGLPSSCTPMSLHTRCKLVQVHESGSAFQSLFGKVRSTALQWGATCHPSLSVALPMCSIRCKGRVGAILHMHHITSLVSNQATSDKRHAATLRRRRPIKTKLMLCMLCSCQPDVRIRRCSPSARLSICLRYPLKG